MNRVLTIPGKREVRGWAFCPICTHTVETTVVLGGKHAYVKPGTKCPRCASSLDSGVVVRTGSAAA